MSQQFSPKISDLIEAFCCLPGIGPKSAQRMTFYLLQHQREKGRQLSEKLQLAIDHVDHCEQCRNFSEDPLCPICLNPKRNHQILCIVESPADITAIEQTHQYAGRYFVLMGHLSPLDGIGPHELGLPILQKQLEQNDIQEIIIATNPTLEGEATAHYILEMTKPFHTNVTRIAHGVPIGGELEYIDSHTLAHALNDRKKIG